jgi:arylsulfatase A-like enzyme
MTPYETDIKVPLIVVGPGVPAGRVVDDIVENIDLCPTFVELGGATAPPSVNGKSLAALLRGDVPEWRTVALIEHHGPHDNDPGDPDAPKKDAQGKNGANPTTYEAIRMKNALYVEYADGEKEYHDLASDPDELRNTFGSVSTDEKAKLHETVAAIKSCKDAASCWAAQKPTPRAR